MYNGDDVRRTKWYMNWVHEGALKHTVGNEKKTGGLLESAKDCCDSVIWDYLVLYLEIKYFGNEWLGVFRNSVYHYFIVIRLGS